MDTMKKTLPGLAVCLGIGAVGWLLGKAVPIVGGAVFSLLLGMVVSLFYHPESWKGGVRFASKKILQYGIVLLGFEMNLYRVITVGEKTLILMMFTLAAAFLSAFLLSRLLRLPAKLSVLIGVGTAVCGGSAIAATAPAIRASDEDVARSISVIFLFNLAAVFLFPLIGHALRLSDAGFGIWAGTAVNDTSSVVAAASVWSQQVGNASALQIATVVKLTRTLLIIPITLFFSIFFSRREKSAAQSETMGAKGKAFSFRKVFPWFVLGFLLTSLLYTFLPIPPTCGKILVEIGKYLIITAMGAIGLNTNLKKLFAESKSALLLGLGCWIAVAGTSLLVQFATGIGAGVA